MTGHKLKIEADSKGVWISALSDRFKPADVIEFLHNNGIRKYDEQAVAEFVRSKSSTPKKIAARNPVEESRPIVDVYMYSDKMTVSVSVEPPFFMNPWPGKEDILNALEQKNVAFGVDEKAVEELTELRLTNKQVVVAKGRPPLNGDNARVELLIDPDKAPVVELDDAEKIDHRERSAFVNVGSGDSIAVKHPATRGENGMTVTGEEIEAVPGKDVTFPAAGGLNVSEDGLLLTAAIDGRLSRSGEKLTILPELVINGDVDFRVGNVDFKGYVKIMGAVRDGFRVLARDGLEIKHMVEGARIESSADVVVRGGIEGRNSGIIIAAGDITANFVNQAYIRSSGEVKIKNSLLHSDVGALKTVTVMGGRKSQIIGGKIQAEMGVMCNILGSDIGTKTEVSVGVSPVLGERRQELKDAIVNNMAYLETLETDISFLKRQEKAGTMSEKQRASLVGAMKSKFQIQASLKSEQDELQDIERRLELTKPKAVVKVKGICYPGVVVTIRGAIHVVRDAFKNAAFVYDEEAKDIKLRSFDDVDWPQ
jgi:uncharacterized protein (DUF342 family)